MFCCQWRVVISCWRHHTDARGLVDLIISCRRHYMDAFTLVEGSDGLWETLHGRPKANGWNNGLWKTPHRCLGTIGLSGRYEVRRCLWETPHQCHLLETYLVRCAWERQIVVFTTAGWYGRCKWQNSKGVPFGDTIVAPRRQIFLPDEGPQVVIPRVCNFGFELFDRLVSLTFWLVVLGFFFRYRLHTLMLFFHSIFVLLVGIWGFQKKCVHTFHVGPSVWPYWLACTCQLYFLGFYHQLWST